MKIINAFSAVVLSCGVFTVSNAIASDGEISFTGKVTDVTCDVDVSSTNSENVILPTVSRSSLATPGATAGQTSFVISLSGCTGDADTTFAYFESGPTVDPTTGYLNNTTAAAAGGAENVSLQLLDSSNGDLPIIAGDAAQLTDTKGVTLNDDPTGTTELPYAVRYIATAAAVEGDVTSTVTYSIQYE